MGDKSFVIFTMIAWFNNKSQQTNRSKIILVCSWFCQLLSSTRFPNSWEEMKMHLMQYQLCGIGPPLETTWAVFWKCLGNFEKGTYVNSPKTCHVAQADSLYYVNDSDESSTIPPSAGLLSPTSLILQKMQQYCLHQSGAISMTYFGTGKDLLEPHHDRTLESKFDAYCFKELTSKDLIHVSCQFTAGMFQIRQ